ncbi:DUF721 domain-containing protein [Eisenibacter elegans]|jgi:hypothetical protein|uniref:DUF721 domain-containing protein n=1 Tax=Eisenibacter elegans TaxID=997 RepID=UPI00040FBAB8|nr:DUF721 domain-containing protein [Eisenibacter elegans]
MYQDKKKYGRGRESHRAGTTDINAAIAELLDVYKLKGKFLETQVLNAWDEVLGQTVAKQTKRLYIRDQVLYAEIISPSLRQELFLHKSQIISRLNTHAGAEVVQQLVLS